MAEGSGEDQEMDPHAAAPEAFLSHASRDCRIANSLVEALEGCGVRCWIAPRDVDPGALYADEIVGAINACRVLVLVLSAHSVASPHVSREIERASSKRRRIFVLRTDAAPVPPAFEYFLSESQWTELQAGDAEAAIGKLVAAVRRFLREGPTASPPAPVPLPISSNPPRRNWLLIGGVLAALALGGVLAARFWPPSPTARSVSTVAAKAAATKVPEASIAVLPFVDMSEKKDQEYFSDGLSEELIDMLAKVPTLRVPARTSSFYFKGKQATIADIAMQLGVAHVLEGSVRMRGRTIRITAQLIRADTSYHIWSKTYDRQLDDIFAVQDEIATAVVAALRTSLSPDALREPAKYPDADLYALQMQAQYFLLRQTLDDQRKAVEYYRRIVGMDSGSAIGWAGLSRAVANLYILGDAPRTEAYAEALTSAERAVKLDPKLAEAHIALGKVHINLGNDYAAAKLQFDAASVLEPDDAVVLFWSALAAIAAAEFDSSVRSMRRAVEISPMDGESFLVLGDAFYYSSRFHEAEEAYRKSADLLPDRPGIHGALGLALLANGHREEALREIEREQDEREHDSALARAYQTLGQTAESDSVLARIMAKRADSDSYSIAQVYALRGERDNAFKWLERSYRQHEYLMRLKVDPWLSKVRDDSRFKALMRKVNLPD